MQGNLCKQSDNIDLEMERISVPIVFIVVKMLAIKLIFTRLLKENGDRSDTAV